MDEEKPPGALSQGVWALWKSIFGWERTRDLVRGMQADSAVEAAGREGLRVDLPGLQRGIPRPLQAANAVLELPGQGKEPGEGPEGSPGEGDCFAGGAAGGAGADGEAACGGAGAGVGLHARGGVVLVYFVQGLRGGGSPPDAAAEVLQSLHYAAEGC